MLGPASAGVLDLPSPLVSAPSSTEPDDDSPGGSDDYPDIDTMLEDYSRSPAPRQLIIEPEGDDQSRTDDYPDIDSMLENAAPILTSSKSLSLDDDQRPSARPTLREEVLARDQIARSERQFLAPYESRTTSSRPIASSSVRSTASSVRTLASAIRKGESISRPVASTSVRSTASSRRSVATTIRKAASSGRPAPSLRPSRSTSTNDGSPTALRTPDSVTTSSRRVPGASTTATISAVNRRGGRAFPTSEGASGTGAGAGVEVSLGTQVNAQKPQRSVIATKSRGDSSALQEATEQSTVVWHQDLKALFHHAKDRFPDVVWKLDVAENDGDGAEVWGHRAIIYARAPPSFQARYFSLEPTPDSFLSLSMTSTPSLDVSRSASRTPSPSSSTPTVGVNSLNTSLRLCTSINSTLFENELEYLYTGQGFGEMFEFLFDSTDLTYKEEEAEAMRAEKLRKDLLFMWRSRLYSDVRISCTATLSSSNNQPMTALFSAHRFILVSRSPYFHTALIEWPNKKSQDDKQDLPILTLPSPPFTPASIHFTLGYIYTGTLTFSHRTYDLDTAFGIMRAATYLTLPSLYNDIQARIVHEMMHGLFHAFLPFSEYERLTSGAWGTDASGCRCRQCIRRTPRVLQFAVADDVKNDPLDRGARRALVGMFGEGWCTSEFAALPLKVRESMLKGVGKRTIAKNAFRLLFAAERALERLAGITEPWTDEVKEMVLSARKVADDVVCEQSGACFGGTEWRAIMKREEGTSGNSAEVKAILASINRGVNERNASSLYRTLVLILRRPHPIATIVPRLSTISNVRGQLEQACVHVLEWIGKRWITIRQEGGFNILEGWLLKEICDHIELPPEDLLNPHFVIVAKLTAVFKNVQQYRRLLSCRDLEAQRLLDAFQTLLDTNELSAEFRRNLLVATQRLSRRSGVYPTCYNLKDVELTSEHPVAAGSFADIYKGRLLDQVVCLKVIRLYQTSHVTSFLQKVAAEAILWGQLSHPNLLPIYGLYHFTTRICLVSPWMEHGDITNFLRQRPDADRLLLVIDIASGIDYLHKDDIVHGDLKGANILVNDSGRACLADFGLSAVTDADILYWTSNSSAASKGGSVRWQAPELFDIDSDDTIHNSKYSDVYAFACVAYEIFTGNIPFFEVPRDPAVISKVQTGARPSKPPASSLAWGAWGLTEPYWSLMAACWSTKPDDRPSIHDVVARFGLDQPPDDRPVGNVAIISRAQFRDSVSAGSELPSADDLEALLSNMSSSDSEVHNSIS